MNIKHMGPIGRVLRRPQFVVVAVGAVFALLSLSNLALLVVLDMKHVRGHIGMFGLPVRPSFGFGIIPEPIYGLACIGGLFTGLALVLGGAAMKLIATLRRRS